MRRFRTLWKLIGPSFVGRTFSTTKKKSINKLERHLRFKGSVLSQVESRKNQTFNNVNGFRLCKGPGMATEKYFHAVLFVL